MKEIVDSELSEVLKLFERKIEEEEEKTKKEDEKKKKTKNNEKEEKKKTVLIWTSLFVRAVVGIRV